MQRIINKAQRLLIGLVMASIVLLATSLVSAEESKMKESFNLTSILNDATNKFGCAGALLAVSENGITKTFSSGSISQDDHNRPYYIYSISKTFTAVAILKLCEDQGDFLDERFLSFFPDKTIPSEITVRQLLNHTSGLSDYGSTSEYQDALRKHPEKPWSYQKLMTVGLKNTPLFAPGEGWSYSNPAYGFLKELIEEKSKMGYYDYLDEIIIQKIGLSDTRPFLKPDFDLVLLEGEDSSFEGDFRPQYKSEWIATGCLISTVSDIARFYDALFSGKLIAEESVAQMMQTVDVLPNSPKESIPSYGLGLMHARKSPLGDSYGHGGGGPGYTTYALHYPDLMGSSISISLVLNKSLPQTPFSLADDIIKQYIQCKK